MVLGGLVGLEREFSGKPAGLRTNILICLGSALLMDLSIRVGLMPDGTRVGDPARIAAQVVSGIGFLGAGTILEARGNVIGLTTAATMWVVMAIGLTIGAGHLLEGAGATLLVYLVLVGLGRVERWLNTIRRTVRGSVHGTASLSGDELAEVLNAYGIVVESRSVADSAHDRVFDLKLRGPLKQFDHVASELRRRPDVIRVSFE